MDEVKLRPYNITQQKVNQRQLVPIAERCNGITVINVGTTICFVGDIPLHPGTPNVNNGESWSFGGNLGEVFKGNLDIKFATNNGNAIVVQKIYIDDKT